MYKKQLRERKEKEKVRACRERKIHTIVKTSDRGRGKKEGDMN